MPATIVIGPGPPRGTARYCHVVQAGFGTQPPADPNSTVTVAGTLNLGGWTTLSGTTTGGAAWGNPVRDLSATRTSKNKSTGDADPGLAQIVLQGDNGWLDPTNPGSPYAGYLVHGVPIRVLITDGTAFWPCWRGFVSRWPMSESMKPGQDAVIEAYDPLGWLGGINSPYLSELQRVILQSGPSSYWPHDDPGGTSTHDIAGSFDAALNGGTALSGPSLTAEGYAVSADFPSAQVAAFTTVFGGTVEPLVSAMPPPPFTISLLLRIAANPVPSGAGGEEILFEARTDPIVFQNVLFTSNTVSIFDGVSGHSPVIACWDGSTGSTHLPQGGPYRLTMTYGQSGDLSAWINGSLAQRVSAAFQNVQASLSLKWGAVYVFGATPFPSMAMQISDVTIWSRVLADSEIAAGSAAALTARAGETVTQRLNYLCDLVGWPTAKRRFGTSAVRLGPVQMAGVTMLDLFRQAVAYEDGTLAADAAGNLLFIPRNQNPAPSFAVGGVLAPKEAATFSTNETAIVTSAEVSNPPVSYSAGGGIVGGRTVKLPQLAYSPDEAWLTAQRLVQLGAAQQPGVDSVTLDPIDVPAALTLDAGDIGTIARRPIWSGSDLIEPYQVTAVTDTGGGGKPLKRTFSLLRARPKQWYGRVPPTFIGGTASGFTTPWQSRFDSADVTIAVLFRVDNWATSGVYRTLVSHAGPAAYDGWTFVLDSNLSPTRLTFTWKDNGGVSHTVASQPFLRTGTRFIWAAVQFYPPTGQVGFYISPTNVYNLTSWGGGTVGPTTLRATGNGPIEVGCINATSSQLAGDVLKATVTTLANVPIATFDPTGDNQPGATSWTSSSGELWTPEGVGVGTLFLG